MTFPIYILPYLIIHAIFLMVMAWVIFLAFSRK